MMKNLKFLQNTIFTFLMIESMILNLFNIVSNCIGNTWWIMNTHHNGIRCGVIVVQHNLKVVSHGLLCQGILVWLEVAKCCGASLVVVMGKDPMMGQGLWLRDFFKKSSSMLMGWSYRMLKRWLPSYMNNYQADHNHLILVHESHYK
jgi:hypothetical protein